MMELLGQVVIINASKEEATITQVTNQKIDEINISLDNGKTYRLKLVIINNIIHFKYKISFNHNHDNITCRICYTNMIFISNVFF